MKLIGIDGGTAACGFAVLDVRVCGSITLVDVGAFRTTPGPVISARVTEIAHDLRELVAADVPLVVVAEAPTCLRQARATAMLWGAFGALAGVCAGRCRLDTIGAVAWRKAIGVHVPGERESTRKRRTREAMGERFGLALKQVLAGCATGAREHGFDALAIACGWLAKDGGMA